MTTQVPEGQAQQAEAAGGSQAQSSPAQDGMPQWIAEALKDGGRQAEFAKYVRATFVDADLAKHKEAAEARERSLQGKVSAAQAYQKLSEEERARVLDAQELFNDAVEIAVEKGVPKALLEDFTTARAVKSFAAKYLAANGAKAPTKDGGDLESRIVERLKAELTGGGRKGPSDAVLPGAGGRGGGGGPQELVNRLARGESLSTADFLAARKAMDEGVMPKAATS